MFDPAPILRGDRLALARLLTSIENDRPSAQQAHMALYPHTGRAHIVGVTGAPGTGKSTLVNELAKAIRRGIDDRAPRTVAVLAVDPTSPYTGGAILGDRIRMRDLAGDPGVFIRSMASRGSLGGLAPTTSSMVDVLDAAGFDVILVETVGAGQAEVDIAQMAHTTVVVEAPGLGDDVQAIKAGILEIADVLVVNKADLPGAEAAVKALRAMLDLGAPGGRPGEDPGWSVAICPTVGTTGQGVAELVAAIEAHREHLRSAGELARRERDRVRRQMDALLREMLVQRWRASLNDGAFEAALDRVLAREEDPRTALERLMAGGG